MSGLEDVSTDIQAAVDERVRASVSGSTPTGSLDGGKGLGKQHSDITPPCHESAVRKEDVYLLKDLISPDNLAALGVGHLLKCRSMDNVKESFANL